MAQSQIMEEGLKQMKLKQNALIWENNLSGETSQQLFEMLTTHPCKDNPPSCWNGSHRTTEAKIRREKCGVREDKWELAALERDLQGRVKRKEQRAEAEGTYSFLCGRPILRVVKKKMPNSTRQIKRNGETSGVEFLYVQQARGYRHGQDMDNLLG